MIASGPPRRTHLCWIALGYAVMVSYGSLLPLRFRPMPPEEALDRLGRLFGLGIEIHSRADAMVNGVLLIPLGFLMTGGLCLGRRRPAALIAPLLVVPSCAVWALAVESAQVFFPPRVPQLHDVALLSAGSLIGVMLWFACGRVTVDWWRRVCASTRIEEAARLLLPVYLVFLVMLHVLPLDLIAGPADVRAQWEAGRIRLIPFQGIREAGLPAIQSGLSNLAYFLPAGTLWLLASRQKGPWRRQLPRVLGLGLATAAILEILQLMVQSRVFDTTDIVTGVLGVWAGSVVGDVARRGLTASPADAHGSRRSSARGTVFRPGSLVVGLLCLTWFGMLLTSYWRPFDFTFDGAQIRQRLDEVGWVPFAGPQSQAPYKAFDQLVQKTLLFMPAGALLALGFPLRWKRTGRLWPLLGVLTLAVIIEAGQVLLPDRYPDVTDVLIAALSGCVGFGLVRWAGSLAPSADPAVTATGPGGNPHRPTSLNPNSRPAGSLSGR